MQKPIVLDIPVNEINVGKTADVQPVIDAIAEYVNAREPQPYTLEEIEAMRLKPIKFVS